MKTMNQTERKRTYMSAGKKLLIIMFSLSLAFGASAQRGHVVARGGGVYFAPRSYVGLGFGYGYGFGFGYPYGYGFGPYGAYPPYYYGNGAMPTRLALQVDGIKNDYNARIKDVRHDKTITRKDRRTQIDQLKHDRDAAVIQARKDYFYKSRRNYNNGQQPNGNGNGQQQGNGNSQQPGNGNNPPPSGNDLQEYQEKGSTNK